MACFVLVKNPVPYCKIAVHLVYDGDGEENIKCLPPVLPQQSRQAVHEDLKPEFRKYLVRSSILLFYFLHAACGGAVVL